MHGNRESRHGAEAGYGSSAGIIATGVGLPEKWLGKEVLIDQGAPAELLDKWGIEGHYVAVRESAIDLEVAAGRSALKQADLSPEDLDLIIGSTLQPLQSNPPNINLTQRELGAVNATAFEVNQSCNSPIPGMIVAEHFVRSGQARHVLLIASSHTRQIVDYSDPAVFAVMGDGASAAVVSRVSAGLGFQNFELTSNGEYWERVGIACRRPRNPQRVHDASERPYFFIDQDRDGRDPFRDFTVESVPQCVRRLLERMALDVVDIDWIIPHQNVNTVHGAWIERLGFPCQRVVTTHVRYGNLGPANIWANLHEAQRRACLKTHDLILFMGQGSGFSVGALLLKWGR